MKYLISVILGLNFVGCAKKNFTEKEVRCQPYFRYCQSSRPECIGYWDIDRNLPVESYQCTEIKVGWEK